MMSPLRGALFLSLLAAACSQSEDGGRNVKSRQAFASLNNIQIYYEDNPCPAGDGARAVVLVHGWASDHSSWRAQEPALRGKVRTILVDLPGHGLSSKPPAASYSMDLFADAVNQVLVECSVKQAVLVGHSNGVPVIRQFYRRFPRKTLGLVAVDGALKSMIAPQQGTAFVKLFRQPDYKKSVAGMLKTTLAHSKMAAAKRKHLEDVALGTPQHVLVSSLQGALDPEIWTELRIDVPLLVVNARQPTWTAEYEAYVKGLGPDVEYRTMTGVSHFLMLDDPQSFNEMLMEFLRRVRLARR